MMIFLKNRFFQSNSFERFGKDEMPENITFENLRILSYRSPTLTQLQVIKLKPNQKRVVA